MRNAIQTHLFSCNHLDQFVDRELNKVRQWKKELDQLPKGSLYCSARSNGIFYYHCYDRRKTGITRNPDLIYALARKKYLKLRIDEARIGMQRVIDNMKTCTRRKTGNTYESSKRSSTESKGTVSPVGTGSRPNAATVRHIGIGTSALNDLLQYYVELGLDIMRVTCSKEQYSWVHSDYFHNQQYKEQLIFETYSGIKVRSKSEQAIGNELELRGIPYRYEQGMEFDVSWMSEVGGTSLGKYKTYFPDFTILTGKGEYILWEHLGRVDLSGYRAHNMEKIAAYRHSGKYPDSRMILTFETDFKSLMTIARLIDDRILPHVY